MLYGIDTAQRGRAGKKPDKVLYAPWSGSPMAGTMEITFGGKDITLLRSTRIPSAPMRVFSAVYSRSGQPVLDLTGENAGETLTGASLPVFERTAFIGPAGLGVSRRLPRQTRRFAPGSSAARSRTRRRKTEPLTTNGGRKKPSARQTHPV